MWVSGSSLLQGMFVSTSEFLGVLSVLAHFVCRLAGVRAICQIILKTPILRTDDPSSQHRVGLPGFSVLIAERVEQRSIATRFINVIYLINIFDLCDLSAIPEEQSKIHISASYR